MDRQNKHAIYDTAMRPNDDKCVSSARSVCLLGLLQKRLENDCTPQNCHRDWCKERQQITCWVRPKHRLACNKWIQPQLHSYSSNTVPTVYSALKSYIRYSGTVYRIQTCMGVVLMALHFQISMTTLVGKKYDDNDNNDVKICSNKSQNSCLWDVA